MPSRYGLQTMSGYEWVSAERLPPVGCPLVINLGATVAHGERISHLEHKGGEMDYLLSTGQVVKGRFAWTYP